ncbi:MAG: phage integrase family protein, partial [Anaerolineaceae bacterium]|nr:phage integrase family protein [Anaerolineaceae bacterium]
MDVNRFDVFFDETGEVLYNDHVLGTPPLVVGPASCEPQWEVSLFLPRLVAIILAGASFVKPGSLDRLWSGLSAVIIECGQELLEGRAPGEPDHLVWPRTALSRSNTTAGKTITINGELRDLGHFLHFLEDQGRAICQRMLRVEPLAAGTHLPRDVPMDQLRLLLAEIEAEAATTHTRNRRMGILDRAWFLLMLHSGLRTGEVRRLQKPDLDLKGGRVRIEQSKGLKDRIVYLSPATVAAIKAYLDVRGPAADDHLLLYRHEPLSVSYCSHRLRTYSKRCGVLITPHQLRFSCATLLLNAGAPVLTVQSILGHKFVDTTLGYARLPLGGWHGGRRLLPGHGR